MEIVSLLGMLGLSKAFQCHGTWLININVAGQPIKMLSHFPDERLVLPEQSESE
jgi:hypothetical protein